MSFFIRCKIMDMYKKRRVGLMKKKIFAIIMLCVMAVSCFTGCGSKSGNETPTNASGKKVLRVGMECAYAPFNWTQESATMSDGSQAVPIYGTNYYAYGYDVMVAKMLADKLDMDLEIHKVEWNSIGLSMDAGDYDCIIAGMGKTKAREATYAFTDVYYYRSDCLVVKKGSAYENYTKLSDFKGKGVTTTTQIGTCWVDMMGQIPDAKIGANYETCAEAFMAITNGVADVCMVDLPTAISAQLTNPDLVILQLDSSDGLVNDTGSQNVCIATRKSDTALKDTLNQAMKDLNWNNKDEMDKLMDKAIKLMPSSN